MVGPRLKQHPHQIVLSSALLMDPSYTPRTAKEIFKNEFDLLTYCCVFPFSVTDTELALTRKLLPTCSITLLLFSANVLVAGLYLEIVPQEVYQNAIYNILFFPTRFQTTIPLFTILWTTLHKETLFSVLHIVGVVERTTKNTTLTPNNRVLLYVLILLSISWTFEVYFYTHMTGKLEITTFYLGLLQTYVVITQFMSLMDKVKYHYRYLSDNLNDRVAIDFTKLHDTLEGCCNKLCKCFSPMLLMYIISEFSYFTFNVFAVISSEGIRNDIAKATFFSCWALLDMMIVWFIIYYCQQINNEAKKFDKLLYELVLKDKTNKLLKNKKILLHFQAKRKVQFSAMGLFNLDYPLLCSMISTATTYLVILVQFALSSQQ